MHYRFTEQTDTTTSAIAGGLLLFLVLLLLPVQAALAESGPGNRNSEEKAGFIKRAPLITPDPVPDNLDWIRNNIGALVKSINQIIDSPMDTTSTLVFPGNNAIPVITPMPALIEPEIAAQKISAPAILAEETKITTPPALANESEMADMNSDSVQPVMAQSISPPGMRIDYFKHDAYGNRLQPDVSEWDCVEDTRNGLVWEVKSGNGDVRDKNHSYTWFNPSANNLQGIADGGRCKGGIGCDTHAYITEINQQKLCGYSDWRLPTHDEMLSLLDFDQNGVAAKINLQYFPQALPSWYWTATSNENQPEYAWYVLFRNGASLNDLKERPKHIRLVRGNRNV